MLFSRIREILMHVLMVKIPISKENQYFYYIFSGRVLWKEMFWLLLHVLIVKIIYCNTWFLITVFPFCLIAKVSVVIMCSVCNVQCALYLNCYYASSDDGFLILVFASQVCKSNYILRCTKCFCIFVFVWLFYMNPCLRGCKWLQTVAILKRGSVRWVILKWTLKNIIFCRWKNNEWSQKYI